MFSFFTRISIILFVSSILITPAFADPLALVISPTRYPTQADRIGSSVTVITSEDIERKQKRTVEEVLRDVPGVDVTQSGGPGQTRGVLIRGAKSEHTLVLIDGVKVNDPSSPGNGFDFAHLTTDNIERIEVLRGSQSTLYGSDAIGGVINITTKKGTKGQHFFGSAEAGSYRTYDVSAGASGGMDHLSYNVSLSRRDTEGFSSFNKERGATEDDGARTNTFSGRLDASLTDQLGAYATWRALDSAAEYDDFGADAANYSNNDQFSGRTALTLSMYDGKWEQELGFSYLSLNRDFTSTFGFSDFDGERVQFDWLHHIKPFENHIVTAGLETVEDRFSSSFDPSQGIRTYSAFVEDQIQLSDAFDISIGGRFDEHDAFGSQFTYRIAPSYRIASTGTRLKASLGTGFKAPTLFQLYSIFGDPNLDPEESLSFDGGFEQSLPHGVAVGSTYFHTRFDELIDYDFATSRYQNLGGATAQGFESFASWQATDDLSFMLNHTYTLAEDSQTDLSLVRRARHKLILDSNYQVNDQVHLGADISYTGSRADTDITFSRTQMPGYALVNLRGDWAIFSGLTLYGRIENLFDKRYENISTYGTAGLSAYAGVRLNY